MTAKLSPTVPPIYRDCRRLLVHTESMVQRFARYHKYTVGTDLRQQAMSIMRGVHRAVYDRAQQGKHIQALVWAVDDYKLSLQLAMEVGAFVTGKMSSSLPSSAKFAAFELALTLASTIGKQSGGWAKLKHEASVFNEQKLQCKDQRLTRNNQREGVFVSTRSYLHAAAGLLKAEPCLIGLKRGACPRARPASLSASTTWARLIGRKPWQRLGFIATQLNALNTRLAWLVKAKLRYLPGWATPLQACWLALREYAARVFPQRADAQNILALCRQFKQRLERQFQQWQREQQQPQQYQPCAAGSLVRSRQWSATW